MTHVNNLNSNEHNNKIEHDAQLKPFIKRDKCLGEVTILLKEIVGTFDNIRKRHV